MRTVAFAAVLAAALAPVPAEAGGKPFDPRIIVLGDARAELKSTPIAQRPNRPLHVYGNSVRRRHQRAAAPPARPHGRH